MRFKNYIGQPFNCLSSNMPCGCYVIQNLGTSMTDVWLYTEVEPTIRYLEKNEWLVIKDGEIGCCQ